MAEMRQMQLMQERNLTALLGNQDRSTQSDFDIRPATVSGSLDNISHAASENILHIQATC